MQCIRTISLLLAMCLFNDSLSAQVRSNSFKVLLKTILSGETPKITVPEAAQSFKKFLFLDAREQEEYEVSHIQNAVYLGYKKTDYARLKTIDKNTPLVIYCSIGKRSDAVTKKLRAAGFGNVHNLYGGIFEWVNQGHAVYNSQQKRTDSVHAYGKFWGKWLDKGTKVY